jgi:hypothetical protein
MSFSISETLYDWLHDKRIVASVAREMGINVGTLYAKLSPTCAPSKLSADELAGLFDAIRRIGYGSELRGILHDFIAEIQGKDSLAIPDQDLIPHVLTLTRCLGVLSECAGRVSEISDEEELVRLRRMLRTEVLPVVLQMEDTIEARLALIRKGRKPGLDLSLLELMTTPAPD